MPPVNPSNNPKEAHLMQAHFDNAAKAIEAIAADLPAGKRLELIHQLEMMKLAHTGCVPHLVQV